MFDDKLFKFFFYMLLCDFCRFFFYLLGGKKKNKLKVFFNFLSKELVRTLIFNKDNFYIFCFLLLVIVFFILKKLFVVRFNS